MKGFTVIGLMVGIVCTSFVLGVAVQALASIYTQSEVAVRRARVGAELDLYVQLVQKSVTRRASTEANGGIQVLPASDQCAGPCHELEVVQNRRCGVEQEKRTFKFLMDGLITNNSIPINLWMVQEVTNRSACFRICPNSLSGQNELLVDVSVSFNVGTSRQLMANRQISVPIEDQSADVEHLSVDCSQ